MTHESPFFDGTIRLQRKRDRRNDVLRQWLLDDVHGRFLSQPGLRVTVGEAARLFKLREDVCRRALAALSAQGVLCESAPGQYHACRETRTLS